MAKRNRQTTKKRTARAKASGPVAKRKVAPPKKAPRVRGLAVLVPRRIDVQLKGATVALEPPGDRDLADLLPAFRNKLTMALEALRGGGTPFRLIEGFRTVDRQQWLYGSGRPSAVPYGRPGPILTNADGVVNRSKHQGTGVPGSGVAADCYPVNSSGSVFIPPASDPVWNTYASAVEAKILVAGYRWTTLKDCPHCEMPQ